MDGSSPKVRPYFRVILVFIGIILLSKGWDVNNLVYRSMDPFEIQNRFSSEDYSFYRLGQGKFRLEDFKPFIDRLPKRERDLLDMYYKKNKKQKEIAFFFQVTQGAISHRISRAICRLKFLRDMPKLSMDLRLLLANHFTDFEIDLIVCMIETTCQSETANILNTKYKLSDKDRMTQVKVRHKFDRYLNRVSKLKRKNQDMKDCYKLLIYIQKNLYMLHEVVLPHFNKGDKVKIRELS